MGKDSYAQRARPFLPLLTQMAGQGASKKEMAGALGISEKTFSAYAARYPELAKAIKAAPEKRPQPGGTPEGENGLRKLVYKAIKKRALGYTCTEEVLEAQKEEGLTVKRKVIKEVPPDLAALKLLLEQSAERENDLTLQEARALLLALKGEAANGTAR